MLNRSNPPFGWAALAGHIDDGESPEEAARRESVEEAGIRVKKLKSLGEEFIPWNQCKKLVRGHHWHIFEAVEWEGDAKPNQEAKEMRWVPEEEIKDLLLEEVWVFWFQKLGII